LSQDGVTAALRGELLALAREARRLAGRSPTGDPTRDRRGARDLVRRAGELQRQVDALGLEGLRRWAESLRRLADQLDAACTGESHTPGPG
jgi:hypothetical protein